MSSYAAPAARAATGAPRGPSGWLRLAAVVFWLVLPVVSVVGVWKGIATWTSHAHRQVPGIPGSFLVENRSCAGTICYSTGTFTSATGDLVLDNLTGGLGWAQDSTHQVVYDPSTPEVIVALPTRWNPTAAITTIAGGTVLLGAWAWLAVGARRPEPASPELALG